MRLEVNVPIRLSCFAVLLVAASTTKALDVAFKNSLENFGQMLYHDLVKTQGDANIIISPFSIQYCLTMIRMGAAGQTATKMDRAMGFTGQSLESVADNYNTVLSRYENSSFLQLASKMFVNKSLELDDKYNDILSHKFYASVDSIDFRNKAEAAVSVNSWVDTKTNGKIKQLVSSDNLKDSTILLLLSVVRFKGTWQDPFLEINTQDRNFYISQTQSIKVPMMMRDSWYDYAKYRDLGASAVRLPYKDSDLSMLVFLPDSRTGLADMEDKLRPMKLEALTKKLREALVEVHLPKFKAEFKKELSEILRKLGLNNIFGNANFSKMLKSAGNLKVSSFLHKAVIEVNERGTEAAAATVGEVSVHMMPDIFHADHPFHYKIVNADNVVFFEGNVVKF